MRQYSISIWSSFFCRLSKSDRHISTHSREYTGSDTVCTVTVSDHTACHRPLTIRSPAANTVYDQRD